MKLQDYKELMTRAFSRNTRRGYADWRDCGELCMDVVNNLERAKEELCAESRYDDLFTLCNWTYYNGAEQTKMILMGKHRNSAPMYLKSGRPFTRTVNRSCRIVRCWILC